MNRYIVQRLLLLPLTLFAIVFVTFIILNLAPGEPVYLAQTSSEGGVAGRQTNVVGGPEDRYLQFRHSFGLTLPLVYNDWPRTSKKRVIQDIEQLEIPDLSAKTAADLRVNLRDRARFCLGLFLQIAEDKQLSFATRKYALHFFVRGATRFSYVGPNCTEQMRLENEQIASDNLFLQRFVAHDPKNMTELLEQVQLLSVWFSEREYYLAMPTVGPAYWKIAFFETRFSKYMKKTLTLDFGVLRNNPNKTVLTEVISRLRYSLTLSVLPMFVTFVLCQIFGLLMARFEGSFFDQSVHLLFLILWATPVFVVGPFLIERVALHHNFPGTDLPFPIRGFSSPDSIYLQLTSWQRLGDILRHITLPLVTVFYASMAVQTRLSRAVFLECMQQEYVNTARAKGVGSFFLYVVHVGRNAAIPIITSIAGSLGLILGGSVIIETIFDIHGFGKFFYDAILNRDYNVMMFSTLAGSFLGLVGYLFADIAYMMLDPRVQLQK